MINEHFKISPA